MGVPSNLRARPYPLALVIKPYRSPRCHGCKLWFTPPESLSLVNFLKRAELDSSSTWTFLSTRLRALFIRHAFRVYGNAERDTSSWFFRGRGSGMSRFSWFYLFLFLLYFFFLFIYFLNYRRIDVMKSLPWKKNSRKIGNSRRFVRLNLRYNRKKKQGFVIFSKKNFKT